MDYRNDNRTPRDRIDENFRRRMMQNENNCNRSNEMREIRPVYARNISGTVNSRSAESRCGCNRRQSDNTRVYDNMTVRQMVNNGNNSQSENNSCGCARNSESSIINQECLSTFPLAMVYSPMQNFDNITEVSGALCRGTIFEQLDLPFNHARCCKGEGR